MVVLRTPDLCQHVVKWPVNSNNTSIARSATCVATTQQIWRNMSTVSLANYYLHLAAPQSAQSSSGNYNQLWNGGVLGHCTDIEISSKTSAGNTQTSLSEIKTYPSNYQFVQMGHFLLAQTEHIYKYGCAQHWKHVILGEKLTTSCSGLLPNFMFPNECNQL